MKQGVELIAVGNLPVNHVELGIPHGFQGRSSSMFCFEPIPIGMESLSFCFDSDFFIDPQ